jgi:cytochrome c
MNILKLMFLSVVVVGIIFACKAKTEKEKVEAPTFVMAGNVEKGKSLFNDPNFGNGTAGKSCNSCHPEGRGLEKSGEKTEFNIMGKKQNSLEEAVNFCIENALKGTPIDPEGQDMKDIVAYIKSLKPTEAARAPSY